MTKLEDDIFSFGFILLESLVGPLVSAKREMFLRDELVILKILDQSRLNLVSSYHNLSFASSFHILKVG